MLRLFALVTLLSGASLTHAQQAPAPTAPAPTAEIPPAPYAQPPVQYAQPPVQYAQPPAQYAQPPVQYAPPAPPPPPGYGYPVPQDPAQRAAVIGELSSVDARLQAVQRERSSHRIGGPIAMMSVGYGCSLIFMGVALAQWSLAEDIQTGDFTSYNSRGGDDYYYDYDGDRYDLNNDGRIDGDDEDKARRQARVLGGLTGIAAGIGITGTVVLVQRLAKRHQLAPEIEKLKGRRLELLRHLQYGGAPSQSGLQLTLSGKF
jgi:hypothetical protein